MANDDERMRASQRLIALGRKVASADRVKSALGTKLIASGLALLCLAGGIDYFGPSPETQQALLDMTRDSGQGGLVETYQQVGGTMDELKKEAIDHVPVTVRDYLALVTLGVGLLLLAFGLRVKARAAGDERGRTIRDVGRVILGPGLGGAALFLVATWQRSPQLRASVGGFWSDLREGRMEQGELWTRTLKFAPWAWQGAGEALLLGLLLLAIWIGFIVFAPARPGLFGQIVRRTAGSGAMFCVVCYLGITLVTVASSGTGLPHLVWHWKVNPTASAITLGFMALGAGLSRAGSAQLRADREAAAGQG